MTKPIPNKGTDPLVHTTRLFRLLNPELYLLKATGGRQKLALYGTFALIGALMFSAHQRDLAEEAKRD
ncbi:hypothetical protein CYMTET_16645 [Cymbomonas tetramitiformis]|uniref:Uncharacterized protein n=1 Tax=Cymbomonas tetramitiformis TaxID=36881 RepID=A0AAE0GBR3_9CHLO|nr:hypothetical protein CYMTET_16645 [Cymbomonas tetramitiformis]